MPFLSLDDPFKSPHACTPVREYGASDVTSDESTDLSSPAEPSSPQAPDVDDHADISPSVPIILPDRHIEDALSVDILELHEVSYHIQHPFTHISTRPHRQRYAKAIKKRRERDKAILTLWSIEWRFPLIPTSLFNNDKKLLPMSPFPFILIHHTLVEFITHNGFLCASYKIREQDRDNP